MWRNNIHRLMHTYQEVRTKGRESALLSDSSIAQARDPPQLKLDRLQSDMSLSGNGMPVNTGVARVTSVAWPNKGFKPSLPCLWRSLSHGSDSDHPSASHRSPSRVITWPLVFFITSRLPAHSGIGNFSYNTALTNLSGPPDNALGDL